jgi:hypothetical protein
MKLTSSSGTRYTIPTIDSTTSPMRLALAPPLRITPGAQLVLDVTADVASTASLSLFVLGIDAVDRVTLSDANDGASIVATSGETYPWRTNPVALTLPAEELIVSTDDTTSVTVNVGQPDVLVFDGTVLNGSPAQSADVRVSRLSLDFFDVDGNPIDAIDVVRRLSLLADGTVYFEATAFPLGGNRVECDVTSTLLLGPGAPKRVTLLADTQPFPGAAGFYVTINSDAQVVARDDHSGDDVVVTSAPPADFPLHSRRLRFQAPATRLAVSGTTDSPETILPSASDVPIMTLSLMHADSVDASAMMVDSVTVEFVDPLGTPLKPGDWLSSLRFVSGADTLAAVTSLSITDPVVECKLSPPIVLEAGGSDSLTLFIDARGLVAPTRFFARMDRHQIHALDTNDSRRVLGIEGDFPLLAGPYWLRIPGANIFCSLASRVPANVSGNEQGLAAFDLTMENRNAPGYTGATLSEILVEVARDDGKPVAASDLFSAVRLQLGDTTSVAGAMQENDLRFAFSPALDVDAGDVLAMTLLTDMDASLSNCGFRFLIREATSLALRDASTDEVIGAQSDAAFPLASSAAHILGASTTEGFTNYPNPFAAGRTETRVTFFLDEPSRVTLKLYTLWGKEVTTLLGGSRYAAGLHQDVTWDGRTGDGDVVNNGVYYLWFEAVGDSGSKVTLKRKVGVVR